MTTELSLGGPEPYVACWLAPSTVRDVPGVVVTPVRAALLAPAWVR